MGRCLYICLCKNYRTHDKSKLREHLQRKISCIPQNVDRSLINIDTLLVNSKQIHENLSHLTEDEKFERKRQQKIKCNTENKTMLGLMTIKQFSSMLYQNMKCHTNTRNEKRLLNNKILHHELSWAVDDIIKMLKDTNEVYIIPETILGPLIFPLKLTNGFHNSAAFDRIDNELGYFKENIEIRPHFLNTPYKLSTSQIKDIVEFREKNQDIQELLGITKLINNYSFTNFFHELAAQCKSNSRVSDHEYKTFEFDSIKECGLFFIKLFIEQGGRCAYSKIPIYPEKQHVYKISPERVDPSKGYSKNNVVLITIGLNGRPAGQFLNEHLTDEQKLIAINAGCFNQDYWDQCTKVTPDIIIKCEEVKEYGRKILLENLSDKIKNQIYLKC